MKRTITAGMLFLLILFSMPVSPDAANPCFSVLGTDLKIHVPALSYGNGLFTLDLDYSGTGPTAEQTVWFKYTAVGASTLTACSYPAALFIDKGKYIVRLPMIKYGTTSFWAELEYVQSTDGQIWFKVADVGFMPNQVFVTSVQGTGNLGSWSDAGGKTGLEAGDAICRNRAASAGLQGTFRAWLSDDTNDAYCRVHGLSGKKSSNCGQASLPASAGPWVRTDGFPFGETIGQLLHNGNVYAPLRNDEFGNTVTSASFHFANTSFDGTLHTSFPSPCSNWTSDANAPVGTGTLSGTYYAWTEGFAVTCASSLPISCFQTDGGGTIPNFGVPGKKVFLTSVKGNGNLGSWPDAAGHTGIAAGDAVCRARAAAAGLPNAAQFKAWLSDSTADARDRITSDGPWVRPDGAMIAVSRADLLEGRLFTSINLTETMIYMSAGVLTGTGPDGVKKPDTCNNWKNGTSAFNGAGANAYFASLSDFSLPCNDNWFSRLYCFEDD